MDVIDIVIYGKFETAVYAFAIQRSKPNRVLM